MMEEIIWVQKYRPKTIDECILPLRIKQIFKKYVQEGVITDNLLLAGPPGLGKTTIAKALMNELDSEYIFINASLHGNIDTLRNEVYNFASKMSMDGGRKYIIWDEAERMTANTQDAIRGFIEEFSKSVGFIFTCNSKSMIAPAIKSRTSLIEFTISKTERPGLLKSFFKRVCEILDKENIEYDQKAVIDYMANSKNALDFRSILIGVQTASKLGKITAETLHSKSDQGFEELIQFLKNKDFSKTRAWVAQNPEFNQLDIFRKFYDTASEYITKNTIPLLVILIGKYQYQAAFVADGEVNLAAFLVEVMVDCEFL